MSDSENNSLVRRGADGRLVLPRPKRVSEGERLLLVAAKISQLCLIFDATASRKPFFDEAKGIMGEICNLAKRYDASLHLQHFSGGEVTNRPNITSEEAIRIINSAECKSGLTQLIQTLKNTTEHKPNSPIVIVSDTIEDNLNDLYNLINKLKQSGANIFLVLDETTNSPSGITEIFEKMASATGNPLLLLYKTDLIEILSAVLADASGDEKELLKHARKNNQAARAIAEKRGYRLLDVPKNE